MYLDCVTDCLASYSKEILREEMRTTIVWLTAWLFGIRTFRITRR